jgi:hypothetical protein
MSRDQRMADNWALLHALEQAGTKQAPVAVAFNLVGARMLSPGVQPTQLQQQAISSCVPGRSPQQSVAWTSPHAIGMPHLSSPCGTNSI